MSDKLTESLSLRVSPLMKKEYDELSEENKKRLKRKIFDTIGRFCWSENHYDSHFYFEGDIT